MGADVLRELRFAWRERFVRWALLLALATSLAALAAGTLVAFEQQRELETLQAASAEERTQVLEGRTDPGDIAYSVFHLTYAKPSPLTFAAIGTREEFSWKHRLRMLALEGQIHEVDNRNVELSVLGGFDFAYVISILLPLLVICLLFDLEARERREARYELLWATSQGGRSVFLARALARVLLLFAALILPFLAFAIAHDVSAVSGLVVTLLTLVHLLFWLGVCRIVTSRNIEGVTAALCLLGIWILLCIVVPIVGKAVVERAVEVPDGGDILLIQRETVNDAWDLPKAATMGPFVDAYPEWKDYADIDRPFEWKWYYAFQEMGDRAAKPGAAELYAGMTDRDSAMGWVALLSPSLLANRVLTRFAQTDVLAHLRYVHCARQFHAALRHFHYPILFGKEPFSEARMAQLPEFVPCTTAVPGAE